MAAKDLVLGLIIDRSDYGYSLRRRFGELFGDAGFAESIVYSALDSLEKDSLIEPVGTRKSGKAGRRDMRNSIYGATESGVAYFDEWMAEPSPPAPVREDLRMKLALCKERHVPRLIDLAWAQEQQCVERLRQLQIAEPDTPALDACSTLPQALEALLLDEDVAYMQTRIERLQQTRNVLRRFVPEQRGLGGSALSLARGRK
jgi:DNA-binding PadR family transcriptional regulator